MTQIERWFKAQFGALPCNPSDRQKLEQKVSVLQAELESAQQDLDNENRLRLQWKAVLYARNAAPNFTF